MRRLLRRLERLRDHHSAAVRLGAVARPAIQVQPPGSEPALARTRTPRRAAPPRPRRPAYALRLDRYIGRAWVGTKAAVKDASGAVLSPSRKMTVEEAQGPALKLVLTVVGIYAIFLGLSGASRAVLRAAVLCASLTLTQCSASWATRRRESSGLRRRAAAPRRRVRVMRPRVMRLATSWRRGCVLPCGSECASISCSASLVLGQRCCGRDLQADWRMWSQVRCRSRCRGGPPPPAPPPPRAAAAGGARRLKRLALSAAVSPSGSHPPSSAESLACS